MASLATAQQYQYPPPPPPLPQQRPHQPLNFQQSVAQAKDELKHFFARDKPVHDSINNIQEYYEGIKERDMRDLKPRRRLARPCKVLPDPNPVLVNTRLTEPTQLYHPLRKSEEFFGKFAPPVSLGKEALLDSPSVAAQVNVDQRNYGNPVYVNGAFTNQPSNADRRNYANPLTNQPNYNQAYINPIANNPSQNQLIPAQQQQFVPQPPPQQIVQVPMFMTQRETVYLTPTPVSPDFDPYDPTSTPTQAPAQNNGNGFLANFGKWIVPTAAPAAASSVDPAALLSSLSAMQSSMSAQSASISSASAMAYYASIAASLSAREALLSAQMAATPAYGYRDNNNGYRDNNNGYRDNSGYRDNNNGYNRYDYNGR